MIDGQLHTTDSLTADAAARFAADSTALQGADTLAAAADEAPFSLLEQLRTPLAETAPTYRETTMAAIFGPRSVQASMPFDHAAPTDPLSTPAYHGAGLLLLLCYGILLYRHLDDAGRLLARLRHNQASEKRRYEDSGSSYTRFLRISTVLGLLTAGLAVVRLTAGCLPPQAVGALPRTLALLCSLATAAALGLVLLYRRGLTAGIGVLTYTTPLVERLWLVKRHTSALLTIVLLPPLLFWLLAPQEGGGGWFVVIIIELLAVLALYLRETLLLFLSKKISILHWFLYLCVVEIFPLSLLILLAARYLA